MITRYSVQNLHCSGCAARIEEAFCSLPGITGASIDVTAQRMRLEGEAVTLDTLNTIADGIEAGTCFTPLPADHAATDGPACACCQDHTATADDDEGAAPLWPMVVSAVLLAAGLLGGETLERHLPPLLVNTLLYGLPYIVCGHAVLRKGLTSLLRGDVFNEFTLMGGATLAAIAIGELPEAVGVMLFYNIGEYVQERAAGSSRRSIRALLAARPTVAHVLPESDTMTEGDKDAGAAQRDVSPEAVLPGMHLLVRPGEKIPLDGEVLTGASQIDTSPLTGEPRPVLVEAGSAVFSGTVNLSGALTMRVTAQYADSSVARILEMVENATARKAPTERFITRFARWYTPAVVLAALLVAAVPPLLGWGSASEWIYRALVLLVISCPCALLISIPLGYFGGIGAASRRGILIKGGHVLDALHNIRTVAFDKTGTLTQGVFAVSAVQPQTAITEQELLHTAALAESHSNHPIARSIVRTAELAAPPAGLEARELPGQGVVAMYAGTRLLAGNASLLEAHGLELPHQPESTVHGSIVHVARDTTYLGSILVSDMLRPESAPTMAALRALGLRLVMLTGDRPEGAAWVHKALQLDAVHAGLLPEAKATELEQLGPVSQTLFVGDGLNDAPVLAAAGVGVAMGGLGSEAAIEIADAVILDDSPAKLVDLLHIAAATRAIVWQNIALALGVKGLFMVLGIAGLSGLWEAVFADVGVALLAVLNASRTARLSTRNMPL